MDSGPTQRGDAALEADGEQLCRDISGAELLCAIRLAKSGKAPGVDGLPVEFFKLLVAAGGEGGDNETDPWQTPLGAELLELLNAVWRSGIVADPNNYRPISLLPSALKLLLPVLLQRMTRLVNAHDMISQTQAGFREGEECVAQTTLLYELCRRRVLSGHRQT